MGCMVLRKTFHTAPEQVQGLTPIFPVPDTASVITQLTSVYTILQNAPYLKQL